MTCNPKSPLPTLLTSRLADLKADYTSVKGVPFEHFFCPFLFTDEDVPLCQGHVVNKAFGVAKNIWTVQRRDVDSFFGSHFEADFTRMRYRDSLGVKDVLGDRKLRQQLQPRIFAGDHMIEYFIPEGEVPSHFTALHAVSACLPSLVGLKLDPSELEKVVDVDWRIEINLDLRIGALVSLLKAAYLTQFLLFGYRYVFSPAGHLIGNQILGRLFKQYKDASRSETQEAARVDLEDCVNAVRPILGTDLELRGTMLDRQVLVTWAASGFPWATIIIIPTGDALHGVMLPAGDHVKQITTWLDFMNNDNDSIAVKLAQHEPDRKGGVWRLSKETLRLQWPKPSSLD